MGIISILNKNPATNIVELPLVHTTDAYRFTAIINGNEIKPPEKKDANEVTEDAVYFFYGRPAYRSKARSVSEIFYAPVCLLVRPATIGDISAIYPFDSGAFNDGIFSKFFHKDMKIRDFFLGNTVDIPPRVVSLFFGGNRQYMFGQCMTSPRFDFADMEAKAYHNLINARGDEDFDDRRYTIEIQKSGSISILNLDIVAVVVPSESLEDNAIYNTIVNIWDAVPIDYEFVPGMKPSEYQFHLLQSVASFYKQRGLL